MADKEREIFLEFHQVGQSVKVTAIDSVSFEEVSIVAPVNATREEMTRIATQKLTRRLEKLKDQKVAAKAGSRKPPLSRGPGILV